MEARAKQTAQNCPAGVQAGIKRPLAVRQAAASQRHGENPYASTRVCRHPQFPACRPQHVDNPAHSHRQWGQSGQGLARSVRQPETLAYSATTSCVRPDARQIARCKSIGEALDGNDFTPAHQADRRYGARPFSSSRHRDCFVWPHEDGHSLCDRSPTISRLPGDWNERDCIRELSGFHLFILLPMSHSSLHGAYTREAHPFDRASLW